MRLAVPALILASSCASVGTPPPTQRHARVEAAAEPELSEELPSVEGEIGGMSQYGVEQSWADLHPRFIRCVEQASTRLSAIGGRVSVKLRVDRGGNVRWAYLNDTTLGDREAELCVLELVKSRKWPRPKSGEGLAETRFEVDAADTPRELPAARASGFARQAGAATRDCRKGVAGAFVATVYLSDTGEVLAAGVAPPDETAESASDCVAAALLGVRARGLVASRDAPAKLSVKIR